MTNKSTLMMFAALAMMMQETEPKTSIDIFEPKTSPPPKTPPPPKTLILKYGNGKKQYFFETKIEIIEIWADNEKSAQKKLKYVIAYNNNINR